ncbi:hypothetical protein CHU92_10925 [Flavobacterium cyanobacteriorum]|uniref:Uncharacterized protein n=1 Tax=Flavobacterium cyanobacteriorum TaxID=2022802 RepID=A0A255Z1W8_9FLAO|nr:hypothetical protein [Flavobacterium cyanobacteriorum]OYQ35421.1 hypothetical protein CHU92_10925 [Flavobacterium cyanobacteriorum]
MKPSLLTLLLSLTLLCCNNDDINRPVAEIDKLPPATQTGANTFGALLDGEAFIPRFVVNPIQCNYQLINGERYFFVTGRFEEQENFNLISLSLRMLKI